MEQTAVWKRLAERYGRDYAWLEKAMQLYPCRMAQDGVRAAIRFFPGEHQQGEDFGVPYGMSAGLTYCFLLDAPSQAAEQGAAPCQTIPSEQPVKQQWAALLFGDAVPTNGSADRKSVYCIPVKSGRPALGWQLGFSLLAIRPLALLRPFYLFGAAQSVRPEPCRVVPLADARRLGRLLEEGWLGVGCDTTGTQAVLRRPSDSTRVLW